MQVTFRMKTKFKILWVALQVIAQFPMSFKNLTFPPIITTMAEALGIVNIDVTAVIPTTCMVDERRNLYFQKLLAYTLTPIGIVVILWFAFLYQRYSMKKRLRDAHDLIELKTLYMTLVLCLSFAVFVSVSSCVLGFFNRDYLDDGSCFLRQDYGTACDTDLYNMWQIYAILGVAIFPLGIPLFYFVLLYSARDDIDPIIDEVTGKRGRMDGSVNDVTLALKIRDGRKETHYLQFICGSCTFHSVSLLSTVYTYQQ